MRGVTTNFGGVDVVSLQGAIVACYGGGATNILEESAWCIAGCQCSLLRFGGRVTTNFGGVDGRRCCAIAGRHCSVLWLAGAFFFALITQKLGFAIWGLCWYNFT